MRRGRVRGEVGVSGGLIEPPETPLELELVSIKYKIFVLQEQDEIQYESYARIEHVLTGSWLHALKGKNLLA